MLNSKMRSKTKHMNNNNNNKKRNDFSSISSFSQVDFFFPSTSSLHLHRSFVSFSFLAWFFLEMETKYQRIVMGWIEVTQNTWHFSQCARCVRLYVCRRETSARHSCDWRDTLYATFKRQMARIHKTNHARCVWGRCMPPPMILRYSIYIEIVRVTAAAMQIVRESTSHIYNVLQFITFSSRPEFLHSNR